ncbi:MAG: AI-2E family transporter [Leptolyngbyaceae cyanobacterium RU_5_1]|nr:AI-2E family transporter [Leptolyngbyaceae cyanobacterium RU_5_1]
MKLGQWLALLSIVAAVYILWQIRDVLLLIFAAVVLANSLNLQAGWLQQRFKIPRSGAVLISVGCLLAFVILFFQLVVPPFAKQLQEIFVLVPQGIEQLNRWIASLDKAVPTDFRPYLPDLDSATQQAMPVVNRLLGGSFAFFSSSLGAIVNILLILVLGLMMLLNPDSYRRGFIRLFPSFYRRRVDRILLECEVALGRWIVGALISMGVIAVLSTLFLSLIGVRAALANGVLAGLLNFIPNLGPTFSVIPPMAIALLDSPVKSLIVLGLYIGIQQFESNFLTPYVMAQQVNLLPAVTLLAQVFFATIFGFWGLLLALPLTVVGQIWVRRVLMEDVMDQWHSPKRHEEQSIIDPTETPYAPSTDSGTIIQPNSDPRITAESQNASVVEDEEMRR